MNQVSNTNNIDSLADFLIASVSTLAMQYILHIFSMPLEWQTRICAVIFLSAFICLRLIGETETDEW